MDHVFSLHDGLTLCLYQWPNNFSVMSLNASKELFCCTCSTDKKSCQHVNVIHSMMTVEYPSCLDKVCVEINRSVKSAARSVVSPSLVSKKKIPFKPEKETTSEILKQGGIHHCVPLSEDGLNLCCFPETDKCPSCQNDWTLLTQQLPLVTEVTSLSVKGVPYILNSLEEAACMHVHFIPVEIAVCTACNQAVPYDGGKDALVNMTTCLVSHDLLRSYLHSFLDGRYDNNYMHQYYYCMCFYNGLCDCL